MLTFCLVASRTGRPPPDHVLDRLRDPACPEVPFDARHHLVWTNGTRTLWFGGWQDASEGPSASHHWHVEEGGLTAFAGQVWPRLDGWRTSRPWAEQLAALLRARPLSAENDDLAGIFIAMSLQQHGRSSVAADPLGIGLVYWGHGRDFVAISSRAALAAAVLAAEHSAEPVRDAVGAGWLAYCVHADALQTGFEQVEVVPDGGFIDIDPEGGARFVPASRSPWRLGPECTTSPGEMLEEARCEMVTAIRTELSRPGRTARSELTGGKDSRLVLALLLEEGLAGDVEFLTYGETDLPDVIVASEIAAVFGLRHTVVSEGASDPATVRRRERARAWRQRVNEAVRDQGYGSASSQEIAFRISTWSASGMYNVEEPLLGHPPSGAEVLFSGAFGEALRTAYERSSSLASKADAAYFPENMKFGTAAIFQPAVLDHYRREMHRVLFEGSLATDDAQDVVDAFFVRQRLRRWLGTAQELDSQRRAFPLYSITAIRLAFAIGSENRRSEWLHFQLMQRSGETLARIGFADSAWAAGADVDLVPTRQHDERAPSLPRRLTRLGAPRSYRARLLRMARRSPTPRVSERTAARDLRADATELDLALMRRYLLEDPSGRLFEIFDRGALQNSLDRFAGLSDAHKLQLYGALTAALWLGGHEIALPRGIGQP